MKHFYQDLVKNNIFFILIYINRDHLNINRDQVSRDPGPCKMRPTEFYVNFLGLITLVKTIGLGGDIPATKLSKIYFDILRPKPYILTRHCGILSNRLIFSLLGLLSESDP